MLAVLATDLSVSEHLLRMFRSPIPLAVLAHGIAPWSRIGLLPPGEVVHTSGGQRPAHLFGPGLATCNWTGWVGF